MNMIDIIRIKRDGGELSDEQLRFVAFGCADGSIQDFQLSAFAMAVYYNGMTSRETAVFTDAMARSGDMADLSVFGDRTVDKHSTGGVGDKTTLILAPVVSALGATVAKMSGRALGHTGGTVDKLEVFTGYRTSMNEADFIEQVKKVGVAVIGQSAALAPADKKLYALRDLTATVDSIPLIASSIMSKKLAAGSRSIVLDVKVGSGAFMRTIDKARSLAEEMVEIGVRNGRRMTAVISNMDIPLGNAVGNSLEVREALRVLRGNGPADLTEVCETLACEMLMLSNGWKRDECIEKVRECIQSGKALAQCRRWIEAQGGDVSGIDDEENIASASIKYELKAPQSGYIAKMNTEKIGRCEGMLGAGRHKLGESIDLTAGIELLKKTGDKVEQGETIAVLHTNKERLIENAEKEYLEALTWSDVCPEKEKLIFDIIRG